MACCNLADSFENSASVTVGYSDAVTGARQIRILGLSGVYTQMLDENRPAMRGIAAPFELSYVPIPRPTSTSHLLFRWATAGARSYSDTYREI